MVGLKLNHIWFLCTVLRIQTLRHLSLERRYSSRLCVSLASLSLTIITDYSGLLVVYVFRLSFVVNPALLKVRNHVNLG